MPFGLKMSQDVFQKKTDQAFENCKGTKGTAGIAEDIQVFAQMTIMTSISKKQWKEQGKPVSN